jgi:hypothetical protein
MNFMKKQETPSGIATNKLSPLKKIKSLVSSRVNVASLFSLLYALFILYSCGQTDEGQVTQKPTKKTCEERIYTATKNKYEPVELNLMATREVYADSSNVFVLGKTVVVIICND